MRKAAAVSKNPFDNLLQKLVRVPKSELLAEEAKYEAAKRRRQSKAKKKR
jgi:hypothetical protein